MAGRRIPLRTVRARSGSERFRKFGELPKTIRPTMLEPLDIRKIEPDDGVIVLRRGLIHAKGERERLEARAVSITEVYGSLEERIMYKALVIRKIPFDFQASTMGGRRELGGLVADFVLLDRPIIINPLGLIWHDGLANRTRDELQNDLLRLMGWEVLTIWDYEVRDEQVFEAWMNKNIDVPLVGRIPDMALRTFGLRGN